jgi:hypothetical protein
MIVFCIALSEYPSFRISSEVSRKSDINPNVFSLKDLGRRRDRGGLGLGVLCARLNELEKGL